MNLDLPTFIFQTVNFLVLVAILWRFLWRPLHAHMTERAGTIARGLATIEEGRDEIEATRNRLAEELASAKHISGEALRKGRQDAEAVAADIIKTAHKAAAREAEKLRSVMALEQDRREKDFFRTLAPSITKLMDRILVEFGGNEAHTMACNRFAQEIEQLSEHERDHLKLLARDSAVELLSAQADPTTRLIDAVTSLLPPKVQPKLRTDARLGLGAKLCIGETVLDGSLSAQTIAAIENLE